MLPSLMQMVCLKLLTEHEALELNSYATASPTEWSKAPRDLAAKAQHAMWLMNFDPTKIPHLPMH